MALFQNPKNRVYGIQLITIGMPRSLEQILAHYNFFIYVMRDPHSLFTAIIKPNKKFVHLNNVDPYCAGLNWAFLTATFVRR